MNECDLNEMKRLAVLKAREIPLDQWTVKHCVHESDGLRATSGPFLVQSGKLYASYEIIADAAAIPEVVDLMRRWKEARKCETIQRAVFPGTVIEKKRSLWQRFKDAATAPATDMGPR